MPHGLYPFSGACASIAGMRDLFPRMRIAAAWVSFRVPVIRQLMGWINTIPADATSIQKALNGGDSIGLFPGGVAEMVRTDSTKENLLLRSRKGFVRIAMQQKVPIVPVYVFGQSVLWSQVPLPRWVDAQPKCGESGGERLSRWIQASIILPYGRFGSLVPQKKQLLYAVGNPIEPGDNINTTHDAVVAAVQTLYDTYKGLYGWQHRPLQMD
ncbi:Diacylglycerol O-acyltransferase 2 (AtDGAT2) [Durusdinium trenchii]|uniref:Diacylglycerol O-acyltransferase 2 (AtDGAT2) n=1 Tax=Durusdinium trenchii TaxID=1381693 RepID=A0ABP0NWE3_9DINO